MGDTMKIIELKNIDKKYVVSDETEVVLDSLNYGFDIGYNTTIIGSSGCGKTTLLNILGGVETDFEGELLFFGEPITDFDQFRREHVSYIFQDLNLVKHLNLVENIKIGLTNNVEDKTKKAIALLEQVGLKDHIDKRPNQLSGGEKQRVAIARALARDTDILLCDEPTGSLDKKMKYEIMDLITEVFKDKTVIYVTHDLDVAQKYSDVILTIEENQLVEKKRIDKEVNNVSKKESVDEVDKTFDNRYIKNLLFNKMSLVNAAYLIIVISAIFMFGLGAIKGVEREVDQYLIDKYKTDIIFVGNPGLSYEGIQVNMDDFNDNFRQDITGFMVGNRFDVNYVETDTDTRYFVNPVQDSIKENIASDLVAGYFPIENQEILYSVGAAKKLVFEYKNVDTLTEEEVNTLLDWVETLSYDDLLLEVRKIELSYKNTYRFNEERAYDNPLEVVGLIEDSYYLSRMLFEPEDIDRFNTYGFNANQKLAITYQGEEKYIEVNTNIYMLEDEFITFVSKVYIGFNTNQFDYMFLFIEKEDLDLRENVFDKFLLFKPLFRGRDWITTEREGYYEDMYGYRVSILGGCVLIGLLGLVSLFNGIKSNVDKYKRDIGIYKTLGYTSRNIERMFFIEGSIISAVIIGSVVGLWGVLNAVLNESIVDALDPNRLVQVDQIIHFDILSAIVIVLLVEAVILYSIWRQLRTVNIIDMIRNK